MSVLVILIVILFTFYLFYKMKYVRSNRPIEKKWISAKSGFVLGLFMALFGVNILFITHSAITYFIAAVFIIYGGAFSWTGVKKYRHYRPFAIQEAEMYEAEHSKL